jgi:hypothetical protein
MSLHDDKPHQSPHGNVGWAGYRPQQEKYVIPPP